MDKITHPYVPTLLDQLAGGKIGRREFLRKSTLLGLSAASAYAMAGLADPFARARAEDKPKGGGLRIGMRCMEIKDPHLADFAERSNVIRQVCEYLTLTDQNNITRPYLLEKWAVSDDLKTWTLMSARTSSGTSGSHLTADDVIWNFKRVLDPAIGSSMIGLFNGYLVQEVEPARRTTRAPEEIQQMWAQGDREGRRLHRPAQRPRRKSRCPKTSSIIRFRSWTLTKTASSVGCERHGRV